MSFKAAVHPLWSLEMKLTNSFARIVMGCASRSWPSGHLTKNLTGDSTGGLPVGSPAIYLHRPSGVSTDRLIGMFPISANNLFACRIAVDLPLPASPTSMMYKFGKIASSPSLIQTRRLIVADSAAYAAHTWNISGASLPVA